MTCLNIIKWTVKAEYNAWKRIIFKCKCGCKSPWDESIVFKLPFDVWRILLSSNCYYLYNAAYYYILIHGNGSFRMKIIYGSLISLIFGYKNYTFFLYYIELVWFRLDRLTFFEISIGLSDHSVSLVLDEIGFTTMPSQPFTHQAVGIYSRLFFQFSCQLRKLDGLLHRAPRYLQICVINFRGVMHIVVTYWSWKRDPPLRVIICIHHHQHHHNEVPNN